MADGVAEVQGLAYAVVVGVLGDDGGFEICRAAYAFAEGDWYAFTGDRIFNRDSWEFDGTR